MSDMTNTQLVQACYEKFGSGDLDGLLSTLADDINWTTPSVQNSPLGGNRVGIAAVREFFTLMPSIEDMSVFEPREFIAEGDKVAVLGNFTAKVHATGRTYSSDWVHIFTLSNGKIINFLELFDNAAAERAFEKAESA